MTKKELEKRIKEIRGFFEGVENFESIENEYVDLIYELWETQTYLITQEQLEKLKGQNCGYQCSTEGNIKDIVKNIEGEK